MYFPHKCFIFILSNFEKNSVEILCLIGLDISTLSRSFIKIFILFIKELLPFLFPKTTFQILSNSQKSIHVKSRVSYVICEPYCKGTLKIKALHFNLRPRLKDHSLWQMADEPFIYVMIK